MTITELQDFILEHREKWGFSHETHEQLALGLCCEAGEFAQTIVREYRYGRPRGGLDDRSSLPNEAADVAVYFLCLLRLCGVDLEEAVKNKVAINDARFIK
jgi:NTP pyrophosphatase (non-canonical NTP hydrolase)